MMVHPEFPLFKEKDESRQNQYLTEEQGEWHSFGCIIVLDG